MQYLSGIGSRIGGNSFVQGTGKVTAAAVVGGAVVSIGLSFFNRIILRNPHIYIYINDKKTDEIGGDIDRYFNIFVADAKYIFPRAAAVLGTAKFIQVTNLINLPYIKPAANTISSWSWKAIRYAWK